MFFWDAISGEIVSLLHPISRLSRLQKRILERLDKAPKVRGGVGTKRLRQGEVKTAARNAAFSRSLVQLEKRGLVIRTNLRAGISELGILRTRTDEPLRRTSHVLLTRLGRKVARWLRQVPEARRSP